MPTPQQIAANSQRTHILLMHSNPAPGEDTKFRRWFAHTAPQKIISCPNLLSARHFALYPLAVNEAFPPPTGFEYLGIYDLCLDGGEETENLIRNVRKIYEGESCAGETAPVLYFPSGERAGIIPDSPADFISVAFANPVGGREDEFREWYVTRHIRHALIIPALINGQVFERAGFQRPSPQPPEYKILALYEMGTTPEELMESIPRIDISEVAWSPSGDPEKFTEWFYRRL